jgi:biotin operon repressor
MMEKPDENFEKAVLLTVELYEILKSIKIRDHSGEWLQFLHWDRIMNTEQKRAQILMEKIVQIVINQNSQVSPRIIYDRVIYNLLQLAIWHPKDYPDFPAAARNEIQILFEYEASRIIDIPLVYLMAEDPPVKFGKIAIYNVTEEDRNHRWWEKVLASGGENRSVLAYARVVSQGDLQRSLENARTEVNDMMNILRAIGFPITIKPKNQFGLLNEYSTLSIPYRIDVPIENYKLEFPVQLSTTVSMLRTYEIGSDILCQIPALTLTRLNKLIVENYPNPLSDLKRKFFIGLNWLGEATKPDAVSARFVKLSFSLEGLIGGETGNSRDTKTILAKRCAIITEKNLKEQKNLYNEILKYYKIRSEIVHGADIRITEKDFSSFGKYVRKLVWSLLEIIDEFQNIRELHHWASTYHSWSLL